MASADVVTAKARAAKAINLSVVIVNLLFEAKRPNANVGVGTMDARMDARSRIAGRDYRHQADHIVG